MVLKAAGISFLVLAAFIGSSHATVVDCTPERFQNGFGESLSAQCPPGSALSTVESCFIDDGDVSPLFDRQWLWGCKALSAVRETTCELLEIISGTTLSLGDSPDPTLLYQCPPDYYFRDISSTYDPSTQDRTWGVRCCKTEDWCQRDCYLTDPFTTFTSEFHHFPPDDDKQKSVYAFVGLFSHFDDGTSDRAWKFMVCKFSLCDYDIIIERKQLI